MSDIRDTTRKLASVVTDHAQALQKKLEPEIKKLEPKVKEYRGKLSYASYEEGEPWMECAHKTLAHLANTILQTSSKDISIVYDAIITKGAGAAGATGLLGLITTFGVSGSGAAIGTLTGAAATSAKLYWLGSIVGGGVAAGGGIAAISMLGAGWTGNRFWNGKKRTRDDLIDEEVRILSSIECLLPELKNLSETGNEISQQEYEFVKQFWLDLIQEAKIYERKTGRKLLVPKYRRHLTKCIDHLELLLERIDEINPHASKC